MQVFDTHRLSYRSAKLRAWSNIAKTTPVTFYDVTDPGSDTETTIGTEVVTDSAGYLFYANGTTKVNCLVVHDPCIIEVSLDGGSSWLIQWISRGDTVVPLTTDDIYALSFYDDQHNLAQYNPVLGPTQLPDYLRRSEFSEGIWAEGELVLTSGDTAAEINQWTHTIQIANDAENAIDITGTQRAAQVITIWCRKDVTLNINGTNWNLTNGHTYLWWWKNLVTDISFVTDAHITSLIDSADGTHVSVTYTQTANSETLNLSTSYTNHDFMCISVDTANYTDLTIAMSIPSVHKLVNVIVNAHTTSAVSKGLVLSIGSDTETLTIPGAEGTYTFVKQFVVWQDGTYKAKWL